MVVESYFYGFTIWHLKLAATAAVVLVLSAVIAYQTTGDVIVQTDVVSAQTHSVVTF